MNTHTHTRARAHTCRRARPGLGSERYVGGGRAFMYSSGARRCERETAAVQVGVYAGVPARDRSGGTFPGRLLDATRARGRRHAAAAAAAAAALARHRGGTHVMLARPRKTQYAYWGKSKEPPHERFSTIRIGCATRNTRLYLIYAKSFFGFWSFVSFENVVYKCTS